MVKYFGLLRYYVSTELMLRYPLFVELIFVYFQSVLESLQKTKVLFSQYEFLDGCGEEFLF